MEATCRIVYIESVPPMLSYSSLVRSLESLDFLTRKRVFIYLFYFKWTYTLNGDVPDV